MSTSFESFAHRIDLPFKVLREWVLILWYTGIGAVAWFNEALFPGCLSWDLTFSKLLSVLLKSACDCWALDVSRTSFYNGKEFLQLGYVALCFDESGDNIENIQAEATLEY